MLCNMHSQFFPKTTKTCNQKRSCVLRYSIVEWMSQTNKYIITKKYNTNVRLTGFDLLKTKPYVETIEYLQHI